MTTNPSSDNEIEEAPAGIVDGYQDMAALLEAESLEYRALRRGDIIEGVIVGSDRDGMVVDVGTKSEGIIPAHEMQSLGPDTSKWPATGETILVYVLQPETAEGQVLLSLDRARGERGWRVLQQRFEQGESFEVQVGGFNKGGLLVNVEGVHSFIPFSQAVSAQPPAEEEGGQARAAEGPPEGVIGRTLLVKVIEINRARNRVILSERAAMQDWRAIQKDRLLEELREGEIRRGRVSSIRSFGVFVDLGGADGLAHLSELSWERDKAPEELFRIGQEVDVYVMKVDAEAKKIALSIRRAQPEQWEQIVEKYGVGQVVVGTITKLVTFGAFARIEGPVEGLVHVSELVNRRINHPREVVKEGDVVPLKIVRIERDRQRLGLSLRQAHEEAEQMGFVFGKDGEVVEVPPELAEKARAEAAELGEAAPAETAAAAPAAVEAEAEAVAEAQAEVEPEEVVAEEAAAEEAPAEAEVEAEVETVEAAAEEAPAEAEAEVEPEEVVAEEAVTEEAPAGAEVEATVDTEEAATEEAPAEAEAQVEPEEVVAEEAVTEEAPAEAEVEAAAEAEETATEEAAAESEEAEAEAPSPENEGEEAVKEES